MGQQEATYDHRTIEQRWQREWDDADVFRVPDDAEDPEYVLAMFPYTSGELHMGHVRNYAITDAFARYRRMDGEEVLHPMGWDSFGLPAENAAEERDTNPREWTERCIEQMRDQFESLGFGYDWEREVTTCDPDYYKWNQWLFNEFRDAGLVDRQAATVNWCPSCETVLADEQVEGDDELCWRCDTPVTERDLDQWFFKTTEYADDLLDSIDELDGWPTNVRDMQRNWIGRTDGAEVPFTLHAPDGDEEVVAFTTRLDTIHGATYFALAPDHPLAEAAAERDDDVAHFVDHVADPEGDEPQGVETDITATNPATGEEIPVFVADFVLSDVGTGALMAVPAHDERDHEFAQNHDVEIRQVVAPEDDDDDEEVDVEEAAFTDDGVLVNSGDYTGLSSEAAREELTADVDGAESAVQYQLRDWGVSRQRYWGTPIPIVHCEDCGPVSVPDEDLPVELPEFVHTTGNPLDAADDWKHTACPDCGEPAVRETDTMDTFVDSSWYFLRFTSPDLEDAPFDVERANDWMPVDEYVGGIEHAVMHLLYSRFVTKAFADLDMLDHREPFESLTTQGMVLGEDGTKMSKSKGNGVSPERIVSEYGADTARLFTLRAARPDKDFPWSEEGVRSSRAFLERLLAMAREVDADATDADSDLAPAGEYVARETAATVDAATDHFDEMEFNRAVQAVDELVSLLVRYRDRDDTEDAVVARGVEVAVKLLAPIAPHVAEECWTALGGDGFVAEADWPTPARDVSDHDRATRLVEQTREDVRDIVDTAGIEDPTGVDVVTAPEWMYDVLELAKDADGDVVGSVMSDEDLRQRGEDAADYAKDLAAQAPAFPDVLGPDEERETLERAAWLVESEFEAPVRVLAADEADDDVASKAEPGRPAIHVHEG